jgi:ribonuclease P protein component
MLHFSLRNAPEDALGVVISVSKKVAKKAVTRNLIKRRVRAVLRGLTPPLSSGLLIARAGAEKVRGKELEDELRSLVVGRRL